MIQIILNICCISDGSFYDIGYGRIFSFLWSLSRIGQKYHRILLFQSFFLHDLSNYKQSVLLSAIKLFILLGFQSLLDNYCNFFPEICQNFCVWRKHCFTLIKRLKVEYSQNHTNWDSNSDRSSWNGLYVYL